MPGSGWSNPCQQGLFKCLYSQNCHSITSKKQQIGALGSYICFRITICENSSKKLSLQFIWRNLVNIIIQPVAIKVIAMGTPLQRRLFRFVIIRIIILWHADGQPLFLIPDIFVVKGIPVVLGMSHHKDLFSPFCHTQQNACLL